MTELWRVVVFGGEARDVPVEDSAPTWGVWYAIGRDGKAYGADTARLAVVTLCAAEAVAAEEILAPGSRTGVEMVAAEREACALACDAIADAPESTIEECRGAFSCADAIRARGTAPTP